MKDIAWSKILSVGVAEIDDDHKRLITIFNELNRAVASGGSAEYCAATLDELLKCTAWHFSHEERLMLKHGYPGRGPHKAAHEELIEAARTLQGRLSAADAVMAEAEIVYLERWLIEHILAVDLKLGNFLAEMA